MSVLQSVQKQISALRILNGIHWTDGSVTIPKLEKTRWVMWRHHHDFVENLNCLLQSEHSLSCLQFDGWEVDNGFEGSTGIDVTERMLRPTLN